MPVLVSFLVLSFFLLFCLIYIFGVVFFFSFVLLLIPCLIVVLALNVVGFEEIELLLAFGSNVLNGLSCICVKSSTFDVELLSFRILVHEMDLVRCFVLNLRLLLHSLL